MSDRRGTQSHRGLARGRQGRQGLTREALTKASRQPHEKGGGIRGGKLSTSEEGVEGDKPLTGEGGGAPRANDDDEGGGVGCVRDAQVLGAISPGAEG